MANDVYSIIDQYSSCARNQSHYRHKRLLQLCSLSRPFSFVAMDIVGPLPKTASEKQYDVIIKVSYSKPTSDIPLLRMVLTHTACIFLDKWNVRYGFPSFLLKDKGIQLVSNFFVVLCDLLAVKELTMTAYHPQTKDRAD